MMTLVNFLIFIISSSRFRRRSLDFQVQFTIFFFHISNISQRYPIMMLPLHHSSSDFSPGPQLEPTYCNLNGFPDSDRPKLTSSRCRPKPYGRWVIIYWTKTSKTRSWADSAKDLVGQELKEDRFVYCYPRIISLLLNMCLFYPFLWWRTHCPRSLRRV